MKLEDLKKSSNPSCLVYLTIAILLFIVLLSILVYMTWHKYLKNGQTQSKPVANLVKPKVKSAKNGHDYEYEDAPSHVSFEYVDQDSDVKKDQKDDDKNEAKNKKKQSPNVSQNAEKKSENAGEIQS